MKMSDLVAYALVAIAVSQLLRTLFWRKEQGECTGCPKRKQQEKSALK